VNVDAAGRAKANYLQLERLLQVRDNDVSFNCSTDSSTLNFTATPQSCTVITNGNAQYLEPTDNLDIIATADAGCGLAWQNLSLQTFPAASNAVNTTLLRVTDTSFTSIGQGFPSLTNIQLNLEITSNMNLTHIGRFPTLTSAGGLIFSGNRLVSAIEGFDSLTSAKPKGIYIENSNKLVTIPTFPNLSSCRHFEISNVSVSTVTLLATSIEELHLKYNPALTTINVPNWRDTATYLQVSYNPTLIQASFSSIQAIQVLAIEYNPKLTSYSFPRLTDVAELRITETLCEAIEEASMPLLATGMHRLRIAVNSRLRRISGFNSFVDIPKHIRIEENDRLQTVDGFQQLQSVFALRVQGPNVVTLSGFDNLRIVSHLLISCESYQELLFPKLQLTPVMVCGLHTFYCPQTSCDCLSYHNRQVKERTALTTSQSRSKMTAQFAMVAIVLPCSIVVLAGISYWFIWRERSNRSKRSAIAHVDINLALSNALKVLRQQHPLASGTADPGVYDV
jgi:hypothetical protein